MPISIAIDGHSGSGKSTLARQLAQKLGFIYVDTGALYRAITFKTLEKFGENFSHEDLAKIVKTTKIDIRHTPEGNRIILDTTDVTDRLREPRISDVVSKVSASPIIRNFLVQIQRDTARGKNVVLEGRDIGTVVLPDADFKFFITATLEERAKRRLNELREKGISISFDKVINNLRQRDMEDSSREMSPLKKARNALEIDSSNMTPEEKLNIVYRIINSRLYDRRNKIHSIYRAILIFMYKLIFRAEFLYEDYESLKTFTGLVVANHCSNLDPPLVGSALPFHLHYLAKDSLLKNRIWSKILKPCNIIPINRGEPTPGSIKTIFKHIEEGKSVIIFPEGTRSIDGEMKPAKQGAGLIAFKAKSPILPVYVKGSYTALKKGAIIPKPAKITVIVGKPFTIDFNSMKDTYNTKEIYCVIGNMMMEKIKDIKNKFESKKV